MTHVLAGLICLGSVVAARSMLNLHEGDNCTLADGITKGICREHSACPQLKNIPNEDWVTCSFHRSAGAGSEESRIVCCRENAEHLTKRSAPEPSPRVDQDREECGGLTGVTDHIFGGCNAFYEHFPYIAALGYDVENGKNPFRCGASLISRRFLLTAAHCLYLETRPKFARMGVANITHGDTLADGPVDVDIVEWISHPNYKNNSKKTGFNDIALLRLARNMDEEFIKPTCLYNKPTDPTPDEVLKVAGWGTADDTEEQTSPPLLQYANVAMMDREECKRYRKKLSDTQVCAIGRDADGNTISDSCKGDSGGPLELVKNGTRYLVGIISSGTLCGFNGYPGIYTRVSSYVGWIESIVWPN